MKARFLLIALLLTTLAAAAHGDDIYFVRVASHSDAGLLSQTGAAPLLRVNGGYLVTISDDNGTDLFESDLQFELIAAGIERDRLMLDLRTDSANIGRYPLVYQQGNRRLFEVGFTEVDRTLKWPGLAPLQTQNLRFVYTEPPTIDLSAARDMVDLTDLVAQISEDSCESYVKQLEAFDGRLMGTASNYASRDWIIGKLHDFGYDSVWTDTFVAVNFWEDPPVSGVCHSVMAYKQGTEYPLHQIIVGGHRDAYPLVSPGADDNASGTGATMEIARALKDIDTKQSFIFVLFDAEETGLWGAWNYAHRALQNGDSITLVLNLDCISYMANTDQAYLYCGDNNPYGYLWDHLADSLSIGIVGNVSDYRAEWDGVAFDQLGYRTISLGEEHYPPGIHTAHDSSVYCDFNYMARITKASLAMVYTASETYVPDPMLLFDYPNGVPMLLSPAEPTDIGVSIDSYAGGVAVGDSCLLNYAVDGGTYTSVPMANTGGNLYQATLPAFPCDSRINYYFSSAEVGGAHIDDPQPDEPFFAGVAVEANVIFEDYFDTYQAWSVAGDVDAGQWGRLRTGGYGYSGQAPVDFDGNDWCYSTGPEDNAWEAIDVDGGTAMLRSPAFDVAEGEAMIEYARWYCNSTGSSPFSDVFTVLISNDYGATWPTVVETVGPVQQASGGWYVHRFWISDFIEPTDRIRLRFDAADLGGGSTVEAAVDAVKVTFFSSGPDVQIVSESVPDWTASHTFSFQLQSTGGYGTVTWSDAYDDLAGTGLTLSESGLLSGIPSAAGTIGFTARATDDVSRTDEHLYAFEINTALAINDLVDEAWQGLAYSFVMTATGGTGEQTWTDRDSDLAGTGLTLGSDGLLAGTPIGTGLIDFTARVEDEVGASNETLIGLQVSIPFICGDMDQSESPPDISDVTYYVDYMFGGGPPPITRAADVNSSGELDVSDLTYMVEYLFNGGPAPACL